MSIHNHIYKWTKNLRGLHKFLGGDADYHNMKPEHSSTWSNLKTDKAVATSTTEKGSYKWEISWRNVLLFTYLHYTVFVGLYMQIVHAMWATCIFQIICTCAFSQGITAGVHRLWSHRSYKAKLPLRIFLAYAQTFAFQNHIYEWARDHRVHHKFTDTDADPHNIKRGFFFSHIGWLLVKKHKDVITKGKTIDMSDLEEDPVVRFQRKYYGILVLLICFIIPIFIPWYCWNEQFWISYYANASRYCYGLHATWLVNSAAHMFGSKPYDRYIRPSQNRFVSLFAFGEGFHNYHHVFPWDYKADEYGFQALNPTSGFIELCAKLGLAYDLKTATPEVIEQRKQRTGEQNRADDGYKESIWGWGDKDMSEKERQTIALHNHLTDD